MSAATDRAPSHAALMDATYRHQRHIYDATRRSFLLGRNHLIANLDPPPSGHVLEIACGTGRNLALVAECYPGRRLYGLDISSRMLASARNRLGGRAVLAEADACDFDARRAFGIDRFERIIFSYALSMIPDWPRALGTAARHLAPGGQLHVVDFGDQAGLPAWFRSALRAWLARFHVEPRRDLGAAMAASAADLGGTLYRTSIYGDYAQYGALTRA